MVDCSVSPERTLGEVGDAIVKQLGNRRFPLGGMLELTERCNLGCLHCYINPPADSRDAKAQELSLYQIQHLIDEITDAGCLFLLITGGEPLLRPDFGDIWKYAKQKGMLVSLFSNGTLITEEMADFLAQWRPSMVEITLYGASQKTYEEVTGVPGSHARCLKGIDLLLKQGIRLNLKSFLIQENVEELDAMTAYAKELGVDYRFDGVLWPCMGDGQTNEAHRLSPDQFVTLDRRYPERQEDLKELFQDFRKKPVRNEYVYSCGGGIHSFHIDSKGVLKTCLMARRPTYDLLQGSFQEGWSLIKKALQKRRTKMTPCQTCEAGPLCTQCPAWSQAVHDDDETPVDYVCEIGRLRMAQAVATDKGGSPE